ncbi:UdgX family uracil-DNA binding protein (plasmid) [Paracoccus sp. TK19116]|uniref:Type-4 uracil-DNA glycosylase n=1 Tax=Paracoccus albicereus TaxID=2922394 RepID=A0ABT1MKM6_9RHOB|nr:UdgX family uracil-DNA binding protein [Paracoccus albicereus]MCQ0968864.1 UdgX family uracil-DNA binding protein [Paracoccus albicereus]
MYRVTLPQLGFAAVWRDAARNLASHDVPPEDIEWLRGDGGGGLFDHEPLPEGDGPLKVVATKPLIDLLETVICHSDPESRALAYRALSRHQNDRGAIANPADPLTDKLHDMAKSVRRDIHKMHAFVRFRELEAEGERRSFAAWFEPTHWSVERGTPFFAKRFGDMDWLIATPQATAIFKDGALRFAPPPETRPDLPDDASEALWGTYFRNIFNPARVKISAMKSEMPVKYWKNLPETRLIPEMLADAEGRVERMRAAMPTDPPKRSAKILERLAAAPMPDMPDSLEEAGQAARACTRCHLCEAATQTVWGEGDPDARLMIVGEQPGDHEDLQGRPFVGPAGTLLREIMADAGVGPVWLTNAVKHFKFQPRGKRRMHQSPDRTEIEHCQWWLGLERRFIQPQLTVALGASAAYALTGNARPLTPRRGTIETARDGGPVLISWHPSYLLRLRDAAQAEDARGQLRADLSRAVAEAA